MEGSNSYKNRLQKLYNQNAAVEDAELTSFFYLKTLALEFLVVIFTLVSILAILENYFNPNSFVSADKLYYIATLFTVLTMGTVVFQKLSVMQWVKQKRDLEFKPVREVIYLCIELLLLLPTPNTAMDENFSFYAYDIYGNSIVFYVEDLLAAYVMIRCVYFLKFVIHCELYYGSRPDRLARLYSVNFGTWNAFTFLTNQKPAVILVTISLLNYVFLPLVLLLVEGKVNIKLNTFIACLYHQVVTQVTVGYGDITVSTYIGRAVMVISIIIGITTTSVILIFFLRLMEQDVNEEESHAFMGILQRREEVTRALVARIQTEMSYRSRKLPLGQKEENQEKLKQFKFNAGKIRLQQESVPNLKRTMMAKFATLLEDLNQLKQTEAMLSRYVKIIQNSNSAKSEAVVA